MELCSKISELLLMEWWRKNLRFSGGQNMGSSLAWFLIMSPLAVIKWRILITSTTMNLSSIDMFYSFKVYSYMTEERIVKP